MIFNMFYLLLLGHFSVRKEHRTLSPTFQPATLIHALLCNFMYILALFIDHFNPLMLMHSGLMCIAVCAYGRGVVH